jgi:serine/threonine-protein kinase
MSAAEAAPTGDGGAAGTTGTGTTGATAGGAADIANRFRVLARVGIGGTAVVYRCVDEHTGQIVAVKMLRTTGPVIPEAAARFRREAHLAAGLSHRHIVRVLDYGYSLAPSLLGRVPWDDDDRPVPYVAMEYVFGPNLKDLLRRYGPLPVPWVWRLGDQLCAALGAAHAAGVVHRDVKPQNVMLVDARTELLAKLTDFGIARQVGGDLTTLTMTGQVLGTPDYLSPEQVIGEPGGPTSDLYALGIVLYELLTGRLPFEADTPLAAASRRMVADAPPLVVFRPDVPPALQDVILWVLRREPAERPASAPELADLLRWTRSCSPVMPDGPCGGWLVNGTGSKAPETASVGPVVSVFSGALAAQNTVSGASLAGASAAPEEGVDAAVVPGADGAPGNGVAQGGDGRAGDGGTQGGVGPASDG